MKLGKNKFGFRPRPFRLLGYLTWLGMSILSYLMFHSFLLLFFTMFLFLVPLISIITGVLLAWVVRVDLRVPAAESVRPGEDIYPVIRLTNTLFIGTMDVRLQMEVGNTLWEETKDELMASLPMIGRGFGKRDGISTLRIPFTTTKIGHYQISIRTVEVQDWFGLVRFPVKGMKAEAEFTTLPLPAGGVPPDAESISAGMTEVEESSRRGNDFSEVTDVREYIPGDRIRDIHWKLSARQEEWMVKVRTQMAGMELTVVLDLDRDREVSERILTYAYRELRVWSEGETDIRMLVYSKVSFGFDSFILTDPQGVDRAFTQVLAQYYLSRIPQDSTPEGMDTILKNLFPFLGGYIRFGKMADGMVDWVPVDGM